ncbi:hypothetical protein B0H11DRAFT_2373646 [Mycena galericulata]|nr:hypothetical protein B0H11DRAFT_2373646 [Mycena galericulata]
MTKGTKPTEYSDSHRMFCALRDAFDKDSDVNFPGSYTISDDPLVSDKERVQLTIREVWKVSGYRFRVRDNKTMETGYKTRLWCCQDEDTVFSEEWSTLRECQKLVTKFEQLAKVVIPDEHHYEDLRSQMSAQW